MTISASMLADLVAKAKVYLRIGDDDAAYHRDALAVYGDAALTTATVAVSDTTLTLTDGNGSQSFTLADYTLTTLVAAIDARIGWEATLLAKGDIPAVDLVRRASTSCLTQENEVTLRREDETLLELLITGLLARIETGLMRNLTSQTYREVYPVPRGRLLTLRQPQVTQVERVMADTQDGLTLQYDGSDTQATVETTETKLILSSRAGATVTTVEIAYEDEGDSSPFAPTTTDMVTQIGLVSGWTATLRNNRPSSFLVRRGARTAKAALQTLETWADSDIEYEVEYESGQLVLCHGLWPSWPANGYLRVDYIAGPASLPADVELAVLEAIKFVWDMSSKDASVQSERLGDYSYTLGSGAVSSAMKSGADHAIESLYTKYARVLP